MKLQVLSFFLFLILFFVIFWALNRLVVKKLTYPIHLRYLHFRLVIAGFLFSLIAANAATSSYVLLLVDKIINSQAAAGFISMFLPARAYELLYMLLCILGLNLLYAVLMIAVLAVTKFLCRKKLKYLEYSHCLGSDKWIRCPWFVVNKFYKDNNGSAELTNKGFIMGIWVRHMKNVVAVLWAAEFILLYFSILWGGSVWNENVLAITKAVYLLPILSYFIIEQIQFFFEGPEITEIGTFGSTDMKEQMIGEIGTLMYQYREIFSGSDILLYSEKGKGTGIERQGLHSNDLGNRQTADCKKPGILKVIAGQLRESGVQQNTSYQNAVACLLNGNSVVIRDYAEGEFTIYLCAYLNHYISQGQSAIILCPNKSHIERIRDTLKRKLASLNNLDKAWSICTCQDLDTVQHVSVFICTFEELLDMDVEHRNSQLIVDMFCTIVSDSHSLFSLDNIRIEMIFSKLNALPNMKQFVFISGEDNESLRSKLKLFLPHTIEVLPFSNDIRIPKTSIMVWKEESCYKPQLALHVGNTLSPYIGTALPLALIAVKYDLPQVHIIPVKNRGESHFFGSALQSNELEILHYLEKSIELKSIIRYDPAEAMADHDLKMIIIYDTDFNFYNALWRWMKYGGKDGTLIHVISPFYMMREYFTANFRSLVYSNNEFSALLPNETVLKQSRLAAILVSLTNGGMTESELMAISQKYNWRYTDIAALLKDIILTVLSEREFHNIYEHFQFTEEKFFQDNPAEIVCRVRITLTSETITSLLKKKIAFARLSLPGSGYSELPILGGNLLNYYLPNQIAAFDGKFYHIDAVHSAGNVIHARPANPIDLPEYYPISDFAFSNYHTLDNCVDCPLLDFNICEADVTRTIYGYISTTRGNDFSRDSKPLINRLNGQNGEYESVKMRHVPILEINIHKDGFGGDEQTARKAVTLLSVLLNGLFKTLYPTTYQNLFAIPNLPVDRDLIDRIMLFTGEFSHEDLVRSVIPRVNFINAGKDDRSIKLYVVEFSCVEYGMAEMLYHERNNILKKIYEYLNWYMNSSADNADSSKNTGGRYLHFGAEKIPDIFAPDALLTMLQNVLVQPDFVQDSASDDVETYTKPEETKISCSFCNREMIFGWRLSDGRYMCTHCHDHQKNQEDEIRKLFLETKVMLQDHYHISFRQDINVRFQTADAIRKAAGSFGNGRIVGFYSPGKRQLWIETKGPAVAMESTIIHELTHAWQQDTLPLKELARCFPKSVREERMLLLQEGHAVFVEIEAMHEKGEIEYARRLRSAYLSRDDVYGHGYKLICEYITSLQTNGSHLNAFAAMTALADEIISKGDPITWPENS